MRGLALVVAMGCAGGGAGPDAPNPSRTESATTPNPTPGPPPTKSERPAAHVQAVAVRGQEGSYTFSVTLRSDDTGCDQYADWWEVVSDDGELIYRRILAHSHVDEQPFVRSGYPVKVGMNQLVYVRGHMNPEGYSGAVMSGTAAGGFEVVEVPGGFPPELESQTPLPDGCAF